MWPGVCQTMNRSQYLSRAMPFTAYLTQEALQRYRARHAQQPSDTSAILGCLECLDALGEWDSLVNMCNATWDRLNDHSTHVSDHRKAATLAAR